MLSDDPYLVVIGEQCASGEVDADDPASLSGHVHASSPSYDNPTNDEDEWYWYTIDSLDVDASGDGVSVTHTKDDYQYPSGDPWSHRDEYSVTSDDVDAAVATALGLPDTLVADINTLRDIALERIPSGPANCSPHRAPGETDTPVPAGSPVAVYSNQTAAVPYVGICAGGTDGEAVRRIEVRLTAGGPYLTADDGTSGYPLYGCVPLVTDVRGLTLGLCTASELSANTTRLSAWAYYTTPDYPYWPVSEGVAIDQDGVVIEEYDSYYPYDTEYYVERSDDGTVHVGTRVTDHGCDSGYRVDLTNPGLPESYEVRDPYWC